ncbi:MAG: hypothetical protein ACR2RV_29535 [Verrucomicrobiales bacterium]
MQELIIFFAFATTILWLIIGWRAMRAHESIAFSIAKHVDSQEINLSERFRAESGHQSRLFKQFIAEDPSRADQSPKDRHEAFRKWSEGKD